MNIIFKQSYTVNLLTRNLYAESEYPGALKNSIACMNISTLRLKTICSAEYKGNCTVIKQKLLEERYFEHNLTKQIGKVDLIKQK